MISVVLYFNDICDNPTGSRLFVPAVWILSNKNILKNEHQRWFSWKSNLLLIASNSVLVVSLSIRTLSILVFLFFSVISAPLKFFAINSSKVHRNLTWDIWEYIPFRRCSAWLLLMVWRHTPWHFVDVVTNLFLVPIITVECQCIDVQPTWPNFFWSCFQSSLFCQCSLFCDFFSHFLSSYVTKASRKFFCSNSESVVLLDPRRWFTQKAENNLFKQKSGYLHSCQNFELVGN